MIRMTNFRFVTVLLALWFGSPVSGEDQIHPPFKNEHWNGHFGVIKYPPRSLPRWGTIGSGFVFGPSKDVVTCAHVFIGASAHGETNLFYSAQGFSAPRQLQLKYILPRYDLAVFTVSPAVAGEPMVIGDFKKMRPGDKIYYYGFDTRYSTPGLPAAMMNEGIVEATGSALNEGTTIDFLEFEGFGIPGYSGGPVFNEKAELVAVMREAWTKKGIGGGPEVLINRAFSLDVLRVLDGQVFTGVVPQTVGTNKPGISLLDLLEIPKPNEAKSDHPGWKDER
jgi:S1-C subfamily serine protease